MWLISHKSVADQPDLVGSRDILMIHKALAVECVCSSDSGRLKQSQIIFNCIGLRNFTIPGCVFTRRKRPRFLLCCWCSCEYFFERRLFPTSTVLKHRELLFSFLSQALWARRRSADLFSGATWNSNFPEQVNVHFPIPRFHSATSLWSFSWIVL